MENYYYNYNYNQYDFNSFGSESMQNSTTSNYHEYHGNNHDYSIYYGYYSNEPRYVQYYQSECYENAYQHCPSPSLIGYYHQSLAYDQHETAPVKTVRFCDPISSEIKKMSSSTTEAHDDDLDFEKYNPHPFKGGYDISEKYGKPLPPSNETCYPPSKVEPNSTLEDHSYESIPSPYGKASEPEGDVEKEEDDNDEEEYEEEEEEEEEDDDDDESQSDLDDQSEELEEEQASEGDLLHDQNEEEKEEQESQGELHDQNGGKEIVAVRQIPPGYGLEAMDLCEGVFGGYFPCLWKRKQGSNNDQSCGGNETGNYDYWKGTADYLFGNPNPYSEPVYSYQRHYPQQSVCGQVVYGGDNSWLQFHN